MIGGPPMMSAPQFFPPGSLAGFPGPNSGFPGNPQVRPNLSANPGMAPWQGTPRTAPQAPRPQPRQPVLADMARNTSSTPPPKIRLQAPDEAPAAPRRPLALPPPEELGIGPAQAGTGTAHLPRSEKIAPGPDVDWNALRQRLNQLGVLSFQIGRTTGTSYRVTFLLGTAQGNRTRQIESTAQTESAAIGLALAEAEQWLQKQR